MGDMGFGTRLGYRVVSLGLMSMFAATGCAASGPSKLTVATEANEALGQRLAQSMLTRVALPDGSSSTRRALTKWATEPPQTPGTNDLIDQSRLWLVPLSMDDAMSFLRSHVPASMRVTTGDGYFGGPSGVTARYQGIDPLSLRTGISSATLFETVAAIGGSRSELRLDAQVVWIPRAANAEQVPAGTRAVVITRTPGTSATPAGLRPVTVTITDPGQIASLASMFDSLTAIPTEQCVPPPAPTYTVAFAPSPTATPTLVATSDSCYNLTVTVDGRTEPTLRPTGAFTNTLDALTIHG